MCKGQIKSQVDFIFLFLFLKTSFFVRHICKVWIKSLIDYSVPLLPAKGLFQYIVISLYHFICSPKSQWFPQNVGNVVESILRHRRLTPYTFTVAHHCPSLPCFFCLKKKILGFSKQQIFYIVLLRVSDSELSLKKHSIKKEVFIFDTVIKNESKQNLLLNKEQNIYPSGNTVHRNSHAMTPTLLFSHKTTIYIRREIIVFW